MNYRKIFLIAFICSLAAAAAMGVIGIVSSQYGEGKLIGTMLSIALFSLTSLGTAIVLDKKRWRGAMYTSFALSGIGLPLLLSLIYFDDLLPYPQQRIFGRITACFATVAVAFPLAGLLALTRFEESVFRQVRVGTLAAVFISGGVVCFGFVDPFSSVDFEYVKVLSVVLIITALGVICLPVLHKLVGMPPPSETVASDLSLTIVCPRCSLSQSLKTGESRCAGCRLKFVIEVEEPRCPKCRYLLYQLTEPRCPECGTPIDNADILRPASAPAV